MAIFPAAEGATLRTNPGAVSPSLSPRRSALWQALLAATWLVGAYAGSFGSARATGAGEIGWIEDFALAPDRTVPLAQLIPGTEDYYYFHALHFQNTEQWDKADQMLKACVERFNWTPRALEIENRQALLMFKQNPARALTLIRNRLNLQFNHQRERLDEKPNLPTRLDPAALVRAALDKRAFATHPNTLQGFENAALERLAAAELNPDQRRQLIARLERPDLPNLVALIVADLNHKDSGGFGQFPIHRKLLLVQLDELAKLKPELRNHPYFIEDYLRRLQPADGQNWRQQPAEMLAYLERLWNFVKTLNPGQNSLKAHVLYQRLVFDRSQGKYDLTRFLEYLKLPKNTPYVEPKYMEPLERRQAAANLAQDFSPSTLLSPVGDDEPLVRSYLLHFLAGDVDEEQFAPYVNAIYLKQILAEAKITHGLGDAEKWYALLPPAQYQALKDRIDIDFAPTNKSEFGPDEPVSLDVYLKNIDNLIVKVFEINTEGFYRQTPVEVGTDIQLDGLVPNQEQTYNYKEPALRRVKRHYEFPKLNRRGVFVIDFIGNGRASRAVVRKGKLHFVVRTSVAGSIFTVLDEQNQPQPKASIWLAGTLYKAVDGTVAVPFSNQPGKQPIVLSVGDFSSLAHYEQPSENFRLEAGIVVDREELLARRKALVILRPQLWINNTPVTRKVLEDVRLEIASTDLDGVVTTKEVGNLPIFEDRDSTYEFQVPGRLVNILFRLRARVQNHSQNHKVDVVAEQTFSLNGIDRTQFTEDLHLTRVGSDYLVELLGRTGEFKVDRPVQFSFKLYDYTQTVDLSLKTDADGQVFLGPLPGVESVRATSPQGTTHQWPVDRDVHTYPSALHADTTAPLEVAFMPQVAALSHDDISLLELRGETFVADRFDNVTLKNGLLQISKLPPGDYSLLLKSRQTNIRLRVTAGPRRDGYILGDYRQLQVRGDRPLQIAPLKATDKAITVELANVTPQTRVHVFADRFVPDYSAFELLANVRAPELSWGVWPRPTSQYVTGRNIGDEYRYIIERKFGHKFPGNMLERPSLLLNPWAWRSTQTEVQQAEAGQMFAPAAPATPGLMAEGAARLRSGTAEQNFSNLDFLAQTSLVLANVVPHKAGSIEIDRENLGPHQLVYLVAVDGENTVCRSLALPELKSEFLDLRLADSLDPQRHFTQQKRVTFLAAGQELVLDDITSSRFEVYDSVASLYRLYATLTPDERAAEFAFLPRWTMLDDKEKREQYKQHACHEFHFFLFRRDPEFFKQAVLPYLANKKEKKFLDHWLLGDDLTEYLDPWRFAELNTFERVLLGQRLEGQQASVARLIQDQFDLLPPDVERSSKLFATAVKGGELEAAERFGLTDAMLSKAQSDRKSVELNGQGFRGMDRAAAMAGAAPAADESPKAEATSKPMMLGRMNKRSEKAKQLGLQTKDSDARDGARLFDDDSELAMRDAEDVLRLGEMDQYFRQVDKTMEWVESNYYKIPLEQARPERIGVNAFWKDLAFQEAGAPYVPSSLTEPTHNFSEMAFALALIDVPFESKEAKSAINSTLR